MNFLTFLCKKLSFDCFTIFLHKILKKQIIIHNKVELRTINIRFFIVFFLLEFITYPCQILNIASVSAIGKWNGQNTYHVPMSWCAVKGSPVVDHPQVSGDNTTNNILWRRHERPSDHIYINTSGIMYRSAINNAFNGNIFSFPIINDTSTNQGHSGDVLNPFFDKTELNKLILECKEKYSQIGRAGIGITSININLFHDKNGNYIPLLGYAGCLNNNNTGEKCVGQGAFAVVDNHYTFSGIPSDQRKLPGTSFSFTPADPFDQLVGHELGRTLGLNDLRNSNDTSMLMYYEQRDNNNDGLVDNIALNNTEISILRDHVLKVNGLEIEPAGNIINGSIVQAVKIDKIEENKNISSYNDLSSLSVSIDKSKNRISFDQQLFGLIPKNATNLQYWTLVNVDNNRNTGANPILLGSIGVPHVTKFNGVDLVIKAEVNNHNVLSSAWQFKNGHFIKIPNGIVQSDLLTFVMYPYYLTKNVPSSFTMGIPFYNVVRTTLSNIFEMGLNQPIDIQTISTNGTSNTVDKLDDSLAEEGIKFVLQDPSFPHCFPKNDIKAGDTVKIDIDKLIPNSKIHGLFGPMLVFNGETNSTGSANIDFPIPNNATNGLHLVTIGVDNTALTADCEVNVIPNSIP